MLSTLLCILLGINLLATLFTSYRLSIHDKGNPVFNLLAFAALSNAILCFIELKMCYITIAEDLDIYKIPYSLLTLISITFAVQSVFKFIRPAMAVKWQKPMKYFALATLIPAAYVLFKLGIQGMDQTKSISQISGVWAYVINSSMMPAKVFMVYISVSVFIMTNSYWAHFLGAGIEKQSRLKILVLSMISLISLISVVAFLYISSFQPTIYIASLPISLLILCMAWVFSNYSIFNINTKAVMTEILDSMSSYVIVTNSNYEIVDINKAGRIILDMDSEVSTGIPLLDIVRRLRIRDWKTLTTGGKHEKRSATIAAVIKDRRVYLKVNISPVFRKKKFAGLTILAMDITNSHLKSIKIEEHTRKLEAKNKELERFAHIASHDLKTPLRNVVSFLNLIERKIVKYNDSDLKDFTYHARQGASQMYHLIQDVLEYSKVEDESVNKEEVDLNEMLYGVIQELQPAIGQRNGELSTCHLPIVLAEADHMKQLFSHIIENGFKYNNKKKPKVQVNYRKQEEVHLFAISDNGIGVDKQYYDQIFEMFKRLHTSKSYAGSGIGLSICKKIVNMYGGEIWLESNAQDGSTFFFTFSNN